MFDQSYDTLQIVSTSNITTRSAWKKKYGAKIKKERENSEKSDYEIEDDEEDVEEEYDHRPTKYTATRKRKILSLLKLKTKTKKERKNPEELYEVETVRGHLPIHASRSTATTYLLKWRGYAEKDNTICSAEYLEETLPWFVDSYWKTQNEVNNCESNTDLASAIS